MRKITLVLLTAFISLTAIAQKKDSATVKSPPPVTVVITDSTEFISLNAVRYLAALCRKDITYNEYQKLEAIMDKWLTEIADSYKLKEATKK